MNIWVAMVVAVTVPAIVATAAVVLAGLALKGTAPQDRAGILRAVAALVRELR